MTLSDELCRSFLDLQWHFDPSAATRCGMHDHDARLGMFDRASVREHLSAFRAIEAGIEELAVDDAADEIDRTALLDDVRVAIFRLQEERPHVRNPAFWLLHLGSALHGLTVPPGRPDAVLGRLRAIPAFLAAAEQTLDEPPEAFVGLARELLPPLARLIQQLAEAQGSDGPPELPVAAREAELALARFQSALDGELSTHAGEHTGAAGSELFDRLLHHQHAVNASASELWRYVQRLEEELREALVAEAADVDGQWQTLLEEALDRQRGDDLGALMREELETVRVFLGARELFPPVHTPLTIAPVPEWFAPRTATAWYEPAPVVGEGSATIWVADTPLARLFARPLAAALGVPGDHLRASVGMEQPAVARRLPGSALTRGGWGLYTLDLLLEQGYWADPVDRVLARSYTLYHALLGAIDIALHTRQMPLDDAIRMLTDAFPIGPGVARAAVWEVLLEPTLAVGEVVGRREFLRLAADRRAEAGEAFALREHHDAVLAYGSHPAPLIRWGLGFDD